MEPNVRTIEEANRIEREDNSCHRLHTGATTVEYMSVHDTGNLKSVCLVLPWRFPVENFVDEMREPTILTSQSKNMPVPSRDLSVAE